MSLSINSNSGAVQDLLLPGKRQNVDEHRDAAPVLGPADQQRGRQPGRAWRSARRWQNQVSGLNQAVANAQTGTSLLQTADGALSQSQSIVRSRCGPWPSRPRTAPSPRPTGPTIQDEVNQLANQLTSIAQQTQFNSKNLLDGTSAERQPAGRREREPDDRLLDRGHGRELARTPDTAGIDRQRPPPRGGDFVGGDAPAGSALVAGQTYSLIFAATTSTFAAADINATIVPAAAPAGGTYTVVLSTDSFAYLLLNGATIAKSSAQVAGVATATTFAFNDLANPSQIRLEGTVAAGKTIPDAPRGQHRPRHRGRPTEPPRRERGNRDRDRDQPQPLREWGDHLLRCHDASQADLVRRSRMAGAIMDPAARSAT